MNWLIKQKIDLQGRYKQHFAMDDVLLIPGNNEGHVWQVEVLDGGEAANLSGFTCKGQFVRADGSVVTITGSVSGNVASIKFSTGCYAIPGQLRGVITLTHSSKPMSICETYFIVRDTLDGNIIVPADEIIYIPPTEIQYYGTRFFDIRQTTATAEDVRQGKIFYDAGGTKTTGNADMTINVSGATAQLISGDDYMIVFTQT